MTALHSNFLPRLVGIRKTVALVVLLGLLTITFLLLGIANFTGNTKFVFLLDL